MNDSKFFKYNGIQVSYKDSGNVLFIYKKNSKFKPNDLLDAVNRFFIELFVDCKCDYVPIVGGFTDIIVNTNNQEIILSWSNCYIYEDVKRKKNNEDKF